MANQFEPKQTLERKPDFNIQDSLEKIAGVSDVQKMELDSDYFEWAEKNMTPLLYETIKKNYEKIEAYKYKYLSGGLLIAGLLWAPRNIEKPLPSVVWNRGGTFAYGSNAGDRKGDEKKRGPLYSNTPCDIASQGCVVIASEYRGGLGSEGDDERGGNDLHDVIRVKEIADQLPMCKPGKSVVAGISRGGMMSYLLASKETWVKAVISLAGEADLFMTEKERPEFKEIFDECFGGGEEEMKKRSATYFYNNIPKELPMLIIHAKEDKKVSVEQSRKLNDLLIKSNHTVEYHELEGGSHTVVDLSCPQRNEALEIINRFLKTNL